MKALSYLACDCGLSVVELAERLRMKLPNCLTKVVEPLAAKGILYYGEPRRTGKRGRPQKPLHMNYNPYILEYIKKAIEAKCEACVNESIRYESGYGRVCNLEKDDIRLRIFRNKRELLSAKIELWNGCRGNFAFGVKFKETGRLPVQGHMIIKDMFNSPEIMNDPDYIEYCQLCIE